jgi:hypothetical protein
MRKSATKTAEVAQPTSGTRTRTKALGHPTTPNPLRPHDWQPSSWPFRPEDVTPLAWWRTMPADLLGDAEHLLLSEVIGKIGVLKGREWISAMRGDAAASVEIALETLPISTVTLEVDLAMTALTLVALDGNAAAALVLSQVLQCVSLDHPFAKELSVSWLGINLRRVMGATTQPVKLHARKNGAVTRNAEASARGLGAPA